MSDKCRINAKIHALNQHANYDEKNNEILYGNSSLLNVTGVSDGTCNQINPLIYTPNNICGAGAAGGNRCRPDAYGIENFDSKKCNECDIIYFVIMVLLTIIFIGVLYSKYSDEVIVN